MRTISRISAAFLLLDSRSKTPVAGASILVDGNRVKGVRKNDGHYIFTDLPPTGHQYEISSPDYRTVYRRLPAKPALFPEIILLHYAADSPRLRGISYFKLLFTEAGVPLRDAAVRVELCSAPGSLRVVENAAKGARTLTLGGGYMAGMLYQLCHAGTQKDDVLFTGYDRASESYFLQTPLTSATKSGTLLHPVWELETDRGGTAILPFIGLFMQAEELEFTFHRGGKTVKLTTPPPEPALALNIAF